MASITSLLKRCSSSCLGIIKNPDLPKSSAYALKPATNSRLIQPSPSPHRSTVKYRNINLFSIDYAFRPRLRIRLTLRWLAWRRKPWVFGVRVFHPHYRYSCQHSHFWYLQQTLRFTFAGVQNAPLPRHKMASAASVHGLSPVKSSARADSTSELLRFL